ncbi:MAG TPA: hypothetical protein VLT60_06125 [Usitatibacter sp.]|nr:hypothetical protein [Usitatibacter sp.]
MRKLASALAVPALIAAVPASAEVIGGLHVAVNRHDYRGTGCPIEVVFTASVNITPNHGPAGAFNYHWERSDGAKSGVQVVHVGHEGKTMVFHEKWRIGRPGSVYDISQTFHVNSGNQHIQETSPTVHVECR